MTIQKNPRMVAISMLIGLSVLLSGCFITPGKFTSELALTGNNRFTFTYEGEIFFLGLSSLAEMGAEAEVFEPDRCMNEETFEDRECTQSEIADQRADWDAAAGFRAAQAAQQAEQLSALMGGIDPSDPEATADLARLLMRQKGWSRVEDKGNGIFDVSYSVSGELSHDFIFPVVEGFPTTSPFVQIILRDDNVVRVNAPGFAAGNETDPMTAILGRMTGLAGVAALDQQGTGSEIPDIPELEGSFKIVTTGAIRANNTDEGATPAASGQVLFWEISPRTKAAPTALIQLSN